MLRGLVAVSQAFCFATGGQQPSSQFASFKQRPVNYSVVDMADTIIKSATERLNSMFPPGENLGPWSRVEDGSHAHLGA
jgi:hypothetical protein